MTSVPNHRQPSSGSRKKNQTKKIRMRYLFVICFLLGIYSTSAKAQEYKYHTVQKGETVFSISQKYHIDEEDIYKYNPDAKEGIGVNEKLVIPVSKGPSSTEATSTTQPEFVEHKVAKKETLYSLSKEYNVSIDDIKRFNKQLYSKELQMGETIRIPVAGTTTTVAETTTSQPEPAETKTETPSLPIQNKNTREHIVLPKETKYGIARKYGMTVEELDKLNPKVEMLQPGMMIRVGTNVLKDEPVIITDERFQFYEVKPQETLFSLSQRFGVSQDSLKKLNPALEEGLKYGMVLKVPKDENPDAVAEMEESAAKASEKMDLKNKISNRSIKNVVVMLPYHSEKIDIDSVDTYKDLILKERVTRISLDFYSGILMAADDASEMGISTNLKVYDTKQNAGEVANILNINDLTGTDVVIGPLVKQTAEAAASRLQSKNIPVISPLSSSEMGNYSNLLQARPSDEVMKNAMLEFLMKNGAGKNVVVIADGKHFQIRDEISSRIPSARFVSPSDNFVAEEKIKNVLSGGENWIVLESDNINVVSSVTSALNRLARENNITLFTTDKNDAYESDIISNNHLGKLKMHYPSVDKPHDYDTDKDFIERYSERFGSEPNQYAIRGYDLMMDVLLRLSAAEDLNNSFEIYPGYTEYLENKFHYIPRMNGGFANDAVYILKLDEQLNISDANGSNF